MRVRPVPEDPIAYAALLQEGLEHLDQGFSIIDDELRILAFNKMALELLELPDDFVRIGTSLAEIFRFNAQRGEYGPGDIETQVAERVALARQFRPHRFERRRPDGRVLEIRGFPLPRGGFVSIYADVTERARHEEQLERRIAERTRDLALKTSALEAVTENVTQAISLFDSDLNLVICNRRFLTLLDFPLELGAPGTPLEAYFRYNAARGDYGPGDPDQQVAHRIALARKGESHRFERTRLDGTVLEIIGTYLPDGSLVTTYNDVTLYRAAQRELEARVAERTLALSREKERAERYLAIARSIIVALDREGNITLINRQGGETLEYEEGELIGRNWFEEVLAPERRGSARAAYRQVMAGGVWVPSNESEVVTKSGERRWLAWYSVLERDEKGRITGTLSSGQDITQRRRAEEQLRHSQKMEAVGVLAGGIAHDFNNILTGILGHCRLARDEIVESADGGSALEDISHIQTAAIRARDLIAQLLTFSRRHEGIRQPVKLQEVVEEVLLLIRASLPETILLTRSLSGSGTVLADSGQIHQVLMNLLSNARDAIGPSAGSIEVSVADEDVAEVRELFRATLPPGRYLRLGVKDSGSGIPPEILDRIFDPFFTTKPVGKGTGLGLATLHGIVGTHGGFVDVRSALGEGTLFSVYFPRIDSETKSADSARRAAAPGRETILVVDDEEMVVNTASRLLRHQGYEVLSTVSSVEAIDLFKSRAYDIALVVTDQVMPVVSGRMLAAKVKAIRPDLPVILCTGYEEVSSEESPLIAEVLCKPYDPDEFLELVRRTLDEAKAV